MVADVLPPPSSVELPAGLTLNHPTTPVLWWHGSDDSSIPVEMQQQGRDILEANGCTALDCRTTNGMRHGKHDDQVKGLGVWMQQVCGWSCEGVC